MRRRLPVPLLLIGLSACTGSTDPATGTVFDNFRNLQSGEFDRQIATRRAEARAIEAANVRSQANISSLERQRTANAGQISRLRSVAASLRSRISTARG